MVKYLYQTKYGEINYLNLLVCYFRDRQNLCQKKEKMMINFILIFYIVFFFFYRQKYKWKNMVMIFLILLLSLSLLFTYLFGETLLLSFIFFYIFCHRLSFHYIVWVEIFFIFKINCIFIIFYFLAKYFWFEVNKVQMHKFLKLQSLYI